MVGRAMKKWDSHCEESCGQLLQIAWLQRWVRQICFYAHQVSCSQVQSFSLTCMYLPMCHLSICSSMNSEVWVMPHVVLYLRYPTHGLELTQLSTNASVTNGEQDHRRHSIRSLPFSGGLTNQLLFQPAVLPMESQFGLLLEDALLSLFQLL